VEHIKDKAPRQVCIETLHPEGYGVSTEGVAVFGALPGETVDAVAFTRRRKKVFARTVSVVSSSAERVTPICSAADICGGCALQHLSADGQLRFKQEQLLEALGDNEPNEVLPPLGGPVSQYRGKARLGVKYVSKKDRVIVGFREKMSPLIAEIDRCEIMAPPVGELLGPLGELIGGLSCPAGIPQIEVAAGDDEVALVVRHIEPLTESDVEQFCTFAHDYRLWLYVQPGGPETARKIHPGDSRALLHYTLPAFDLQLDFHPLDFVQINAQINRGLVARAVSELALTPADRVMDAFCGIGNFSLAISRKASFVHGLESAVESVQRARENAAANRIENCEFARMDLQARDLDVSAYADVNKMLLDPPRTGAEALVGKLASSAVERVVYVSCNPHTLARDTKVIVDSGFRFEKAGVIDMFPHTAHIESIAVYSRSR